MAYRTYSHFDTRYILSCVQQLNDSENSERGTQDRPDHVEPWDKKEKEGSN